MAGGDGLTWGVTSATVSVGETVTVNVTYGSAPTSAGITNRLNNLATATLGSSTVTFTGVSAGTVTISSGTNIGNACYTNNSFTLTVTAPTEDESYLNKRGLTHFWENIDDIKQNKLTAGAGILITNDVISATGGGTADAVDWGHITGSMSNQTDLTTALAAKANSADLATVATSGDYDDLTNKPTIGTGLLTLKNNNVVIGTFSANSTSGNTITVTTPTKTSDLTNDSGFLTSYTETDPIFSASAAAGITATDISNWNAKSDFSGSYNDLTNKPTIGNATLTIQKNGTNVQTFTANATSNKTANITVPTKTSDLTNDSDFVEDASYVHTDNNYTTADKNKLAGIAAGAEVNVQANWTQTTTTADDYIKNKPTLATVATSGSYNDLSNKPTIPAAVTVDSALSNSSTNPVENQVITSALGTKANAFDVSTALAGKQDTLTAGNHISISNSTISAVDYVHSDDPVSTTAVTPVVTNNMIADGTITAEKFATGATLKLTLSTSDIGEGAALAANTLYGVYQ